MVDRGCKGKLGLLGATVGILLALAAASPDEIVLTGKAAMGDWTTDVPGLRRKLTVADLPKPGDTPSAKNFPRPTPRPPGAMPKAPKGFEVTEFATGLKNPRVIMTAPNGDFFVAESSANRIHVLRDSDGDGNPEINDVYATGLSQPFGIAFYPPGPSPTYLYVGNTGSVVRFPYKNGDLKATAPPETIVADIPSGGRLAGGGHWTRDVVFSPHGSKMFVSVGSKSNNDDNSGEAQARTSSSSTPKATTKRSTPRGSETPSA